MPFAFIVPETFNDDDNVTALFKVVVPDTLNDDKHVVLLLNVVAPFILVDSKTFNDETIDSSQCGRGDPRFGRSAVSQKLWDNNLIMFLPFSYLYFSLFEINLTHHCS